MRCVKHGHEKLVNRPMIAGAGRHDTRPADGVGNSGLRYGGLRDGGLRNRLQRKQSL